MCSASPSLNSSSKSTGRPDRDTAAIGIRVSIDVAPSPSATHVRRALGRPTARASLDDFKRPWSDARIRGYDRLSAEGYYRNAPDFESARALLLEPAGPAGSGSLVLCAHDPLTGVDHRDITVAAHRSLSRRRTDLPRRGRSSTACRRHHRQHRFRSSDRHVPLRPKPADQASPIDPTAPMARPRSGWIGVSHVPGGPRRI